MQYNPSVDVQARSMPRSSSGQGRRPFKAEATGSNPVRGTVFVKKPGTTLDLSAGLLSI